MLFSLSIITISLAVVPKGKKSDIGSNDTVENILDNIKNLMKKFAIMTELSMLATLLSLLASAAQQYERGNANSGYRFWR